MADPAQGPKDATAITRAQNRAVLDAAPVRRHAGLRGRPPRLPRHAARGRDHERAGAGRVEPPRLRLPRRRGRPAHRQPEPLAPGPPQHAPRPLPGHRPHLSGPRLRHLEHDPHRGRPRPHRHRPARSRPRSPARASISTSSIGAGGRSPRSSTPTATPTTTAACAGVVDEADVAGRPRRDHRARPLHAGGRLGERARGHGDDPARAVPVRRHPAQGAARPGGRRARQGHLARHRHAHPADAHHRGADRGPPHRRHRDRVPARAGDGGAGRDAHVLSRRSAR